MIIVRILALLGFSLLITPAFSQAPNPIQWSYAAKSLGGDQYEIVISGKILDGWATYSQFLESQDGPIATTLAFTAAPHFELVGRAEESGEIEKVYDKIFEMNLSKFKHNAIFTQKVRVTDRTKPIRGVITFMACNDEMCLPPRDVEFNISL